MEKPALVARSGQAKHKTTGSEIAAEVLGTKQYLELTFPWGLIGCADWRAFQLMPFPFEGIGDLVSMDHPNLVLTVADPEWLKIDYSFELDDEDADVLGLTTAEDAMVLCILTLRRDQSTVSVNLAGPVIINRANGVGRQVILDYQSYPLRFPLLVGESAVTFINLLDPDASGHEKAST